MSWLDTVKFNADGLIPAIAQDYKTGRMLMMAWMNAESLHLTADTQTAVYFSRSRQKLWHKGETSGHTQQVHSLRLDCDADVIVLSITQIGGISCHTGRESCFYRELDLTGQEPVWKITDSVLKNPDDIYGNEYSNKQASHGEHSNEEHRNDEDSNQENNNTDPLQSSLQTATQKNLSTSDILSVLDVILSERKNASADSSYVASLYHKGLNKILEKVGEESFETIIAAKDYQNTLDQKNESSHQKNNLVYEIADVWFHTMVTLAWFNIESDVVLAELARRFGLSGIDEKARRNA